MMISNVISFDCQLRMKCRLLFLAVFAISPIVDAYADSLCSAQAIFNDLNDEDSPISMNDLKLKDALKAIQSLNRASRQNNDTRALFLQALAKNSLAGSITGTQIPANDNSPSQRCSLASSGSSPPIT